MDEFDFNADPRFRESDDEYEHSRKLRRGGGVSTHPPQSGDAITMILEDGNRIWLPVRDEESIVPLELPRSGMLLGQDFSALYQRVQDQRLNEIVNRAEMIADGLDPDATESPGFVETDTFLWVDKYGPRKFVDLLANGQAARKVMEWIQHWAQYAQQKKDAPPEKRVMLLAGQPGVGKTTLARVAAAHAGFDILEINASADRSADVLRVCQDCI